jgi:hypothetical protein
VEVGEKRGMGGARRVFLRLVRYDPCFTGVVMGQE